MSTLEAHHANETYKLTLRTDRACVVGRDGDIGRGDPAVSRQHAEARLVDGGLEVRPLPEGRNPVFFKGAAQKAPFRLAPGEQFVIGATRFVFVSGAAGPASGEATPALEQTMTESQIFAGREVERLRLRDLLELTQIVQTLPPEKFLAHVAGLMRIGTGATWACIAEPSGKMLALDREEDHGDPPKMSRRLVRIALAESPRPTLHQWAAAGAIEATATAGLDWAIAACARVSGSEAMIFYVGGAGGQNERLQDAVRFIGLVCEIVGHALSLKTLENWQGRLSHFFSGPIIQKIMDSKDLDSLKPRVAEATIMFFDLRGFSKRSESNADILKFQEELRGVMTAMTECILRENGVVVQYIGDAILACWNVPIEESDHVDRAVRAALAMTEALAAMPGGLKCGVGIHTGEVVAGSIGSEQVWSYSVLGSVVNQASRLEGITKYVETPILITGDVARKLSPETATALRLGRYQPAGMTVALELFEPARPPADPKRTQTYAQALEALEKGEWEAAYELLDTLPSKDRAARYLKGLAESYRKNPPKDWKGVIELTGK